MIQVSNLTHEFNDKVALDDVSFSIATGSITALVGPNGAGKTTLMRCISALQTPMEGTILVDGIDVVENPHDAHLLIGYLSDNFGLYDSMTVEDSLLYTACSRISDVDLAEKNVQEAIALCGLSDFYEKEVSSLSRGMRQRVGIAQAIIHQPKLLILDEPASGLDPEARHDLSKLMKRLNLGGMTILVSSHILSELEDYSTDMLILQNGKIIDNRSYSSNATKKFTHMQVTADNLSEFVIHQLQLTKGASEVRVEHNTLFLKLDEELFSRKDLMEFLVKHSILPIDFKEIKQNMQDEYLKSLKENRNHE
jgi:ABC-2 type transport system ATP-binding protein